jgi:cytochrome c oxidase cbb3-type subunit 2
MYDRPFQWGSKRTGPDLARVGAKYSDEWHVAHFKNPRGIVPSSVMPGYPFLLTTPLDTKTIKADMKVQATLGVPYTKEMIDNAEKDIRTQTNPDADDVDAFKKRYAKAAVRDFDLNKNAITEADALIAYLQMLGTLVDFKQYDEKANIR